MKVSGVVTTFLIQYKVHKEYWTMEWPAIGNMITTLKNIKCLTHRAPPKALECSLVSKPELHAFAVLYTIETDTLLIHVNGDDVFCTSSSAMLAIFSKLIACIS